MTKPTSDNLPLLVFPNFPVRRALAERDIITRAINGLLAHGFRLSVYDGWDETEPTRDAQTVANALWTTDEDWLHVWAGDEDQRVGWVRLVYSNESYDVISDYTTNLDVALKDANARAKEFS